MGTLFAMSGSGVGGDTQKRLETATGHLAARGRGFHADSFGPEGGRLAIQTTDAAPSGERLVLRAWRENDRINWNLELERPRARTDEEYAETDASRHLGTAMNEAAENVADKLLRVRKDGYSNWMLCRNTSLLFQHPTEVEKAAQHVLRATTVIQKWSQPRDKPSVQELAEKLSADAGLSLTFAPRNEGGLSQVQIMVEINDRHTLSIDHRATAANRPTTQPDDGPCQAARSRLNTDARDSPSTRPRQHRERSGNHRGKRA